MPNDSSCDSKIIDLDSYRGTTRRRKPTSDVALPVLDDAMRNLHAAAHAALKLISLARHRLGLPQL